ncbi:hypothetical protein OKW40_000200 [Paraburkholderia sp. RAU6.4a]
MLQVAAVVTHQPLEVVEFDVVLIALLGLLRDDEVRGIEKAPRRQPHIDDFGEEIVALITDLAIGLVDAQSLIEHVFEQRERHLA